MKIRNWDKWQSYRKDRGQPPWIKIHREVMRNPEWVALTDGQRGQLVSLWLLAADRNGEIPDCPTLIKRLCYMDSEPDLQLFVTKEFIICDASMTPTRRQSDQPEAEKKQKQSREDKRKNRRFTPPSPEEVAEYAKSISFNLDGNHFVDYYATRGWELGKGRKMKDWKACVRTWKNNGHGNGAKPEAKSGAQQWLEEQESQSAGI